MKHRLFLLVALACVGGAGGIVAACSANPSSFGEDVNNLDASSDGTTSEDGKKDSGKPKPDTGVDPTGDGGGGDAMIPGNCSPVTGPCDIVSQNCPPGKQCAVARAADGGYTTTCEAPGRDQVKGKGQPCCPSNSADGNQCASGLECLGDPCQADAAPTARCTPHCCSDNSAVCGQSPEGYNGECDTEVNFGDGTGEGVPLFNACSYAKVCKPFGIVPCLPNFACLVKDELGSAKCANIYQNGGKKEGEICGPANDCEDGLMCLHLQGEANGKCRMICLNAAGNPPFDAGALDGGPKRGGCPTGKTCTLGVQGFPNWVRFCK